MAEPHHRLQKGETLLAPWFWTSGLQNCSWHVVTVTVPSYHWRRKNYAFYLPPKKNLVIQLFSHNFVLTVTFFYCMMWLCWLELMNDILGKGFFSIIARLSWFWQLQVHGQEPQCFPCFEWISLRLFCSLLVSSLYIKLPPPPITSMCLL